MCVVREAQEAGDEEHESEADGQSSFLHRGEMLGDLPALGSTQPARARPQGASKNRETWAKDRHGDVQRCCLLDM